MREIKFRAWDHEDKKMWKVVAISDSIWGDCEEKHIRVCDFDKNPGKKETDVRLSVVYDLMQYTGLKDKNGREIYEGDIMRYRDSYDCSTESGYDFEEFLNVGQVIYNEEKARFDITNKSDIGYDDWIETVSECEIIGNIYENPELLEETMNLQTLLNKQNELDSYIIKKHGLENQDLLNKRVLACLVEIGEQANEYQSFKYWKQEKNIDRAKVAEELVDVLHFLLSIGNLLNVELDDSTNAHIERAAQMGDVDYQYITLFNLVSNIALFDRIEYKLHNWKYAISTFIGLYQRLGFGTGFIEAEYEKKHAENYARQERNY